MKKKNILIAGALTVGIGTGALLSTPQVMSASSNVVLASVEWVTAQINPVKTKVAELETKLANQEKEIASLKTQIASLGNPSTPPAQSTNMVYTTKDSVTIHSGATRSYKVIATKPKGTKLEFVDTFNSSTGLWYRVKVSSTVYGWIFSGDVTTSATTSPTSVITTGDVHLRKGATTSYAILQTLPKGTTLKYISTFVNSKGETWYNAQTSAGVKGWVFGGLSEVK